MAPPPTQEKMPTICINVIKAEGLRQHKGRDPTPSMLIRVSVAGVAQPQVLKTKPMPPGVDQSWNQEFMLPVPDPSVAQLECTLWDESDPQTQSYSNFLGEVLLNLARLVPYKGHYIEQLFNIKQGKTIVTDELASGNLKLGLRLEIPDDFTPPTSAKISVPSPAPTEAQAAVEKAADLHQQASTDQAARQQEEASTSDQDAIETNKETDEAEARKRELTLQEAQKRKELARMRAQEEEMARSVADRSSLSSSLSLAPTSQTSASPSTSISPAGERSAQSSQARIVIAIIEAQGLPESKQVNPQAKIALQGAASLSEAQTKTLKDTQTPFWNEKFVFGIDEENLQGTYICAEVFSISDEANAVRIGAIHPLPITTLLSGQQMSLPTVNQGKSIYCIDGWFDFVEEFGNEAPTMSASHAPGKPQIHLRMTLIPSSDSKFSSDERASSPVPPRITTEQSSSIAPPSQPATASASTLPPTPSATGVFRGRYTPQVPQVNGTSSLSAPASPRPPLVPVQREERQRTPLPQRGGPADVGIVLKSLDESLVVHEVLPAGPAAEGAKVGVGDALIDVDGFDVKGRPVEDVALLLRGPPNTPVTLILQRGGKGGSPHVVTLLRAILDPSGFAPQQASVQSASVALRLPSPRSMKSSTPSVTGAAAGIRPPSPRDLLPVAHREMDKALSSEFRQISFLWKGKALADPVSAALVTWKNDLLYGCDGADGFNGANRFPNLAASGSFSAQNYPALETTGETVLGPGNGNGNTAPDWMKRKI